MTRCAPQTATPQPPLPRSRQLTPSGPAARAGHHARPGGRGAGPLNGARVQENDTRPSRWSGPFGLAVTS
jgi:hypothetical protein